MRYFYILAIFVDTFVVMAITIYHAMFGLALREAIDLRCVSIAKLCIRLKLSNTSLYNYINGKAFPARRRHRLLCSILCVDLPWYPIKLRRQAYRASKLGQYFPAGAGAGAEKNNFPSKL